MSQVSIIDIEGNHPQIPTQFNGDVGSAVPLANQLNIFGAGGITTSASGNTVTITGSTVINLTITGNTGGPISPSADNWNTIGDGSITIAGSGSTLTTQLTGLTNHSVLVGAGTTTITKLAVGTNGQALLGATGADPAFGTITSIGGTITFTTGAHSLNMEAGATVPTTFTGNTGTATPAANNINILGASTVAGTSPVSTAASGSTVTVNVQTSQALAAADATKIGLSNFDSASFAVAATGFVTLSGTVAKTITGDSGGALSPTANNWNIFGLSGSKTSGSGSTLTIKSPPFSQVGASATSSLNTGEFVTAAVTRTLPASAGLADGDLFIYVCTSASALVIQAVDAQKIRIGSLISSAAGTATSTSIGDSLTLRFNATDGFFYAVSSIGTWLIA